MSLKSPIIILFITLLLTISMPTLAINSYDFLREEAQKSNKGFRYNKYENIINGSLAFVVGNIGYYTTDIYSLKISYSGIQTIGILNLGQGIYDYYRPLQNKELYINCPIKLMFLYPNKCD